MPPSPTGRAPYLSHEGDGEVLAVVALEVADHLEEALLPAQHPLVPRVAPREVVEGIGDDERLRLRVLGVCGMALHPSHPSAPHPTPLHLIPPHHTPSQPIAHHLTPVHPIPPQCTPSHPTAPHPTKLHPIPPHRIPSPLHFTPSHPIPPCPTPLPPPHSTAPHPTPQSPPLTRVAAEGDVGEDGPPVLSHAAQLQRCDVLEGEWGAGGDTALVSGGCAWCPLPPTACGHRALLLAGIALTLQPEPPQAAHGHRNVSSTPRAAPRPHGPAPHKHLAVSGTPQAAP